MKTFPSNEPTVLSARRRDWLYGSLLTMPTPPAMRYGVALVAVAAAMALRLALEAWFGPGLPTYITFYPMVMAVALLAGFGPGIVATAVMGATVDYWIIPPIGDFSIGSPIDLVGMVFFLGMGLFISLVAEGYRRNMARIAALNREVALRQGEHRFRLALANSPVTIFEQDLELRYTWLFNSKLGYSDTFAIGKTEAEIMDPACVEAQVAAKRRVLDQGKPLRQEVTAAAPGQPLEYFDLYIEPRRNPTGQIVGIICAATDITERKKAEVEQQRLTRTLQAYREAGWALVHASNEADYLREFCRIIVEACGYAMIWIGYREDDAVKSIRPVAHTGFDDGYLDSLQLSWSDSERGRGPTGTAIRTGQAVICHDILTDPYFLPWREQAQQRGYAASIALPMQDETGAFGALNIYSRTPAPFVEAEVAMLQNMADELAYGIRVLRLRVAHAVQEAALRASEEHFRLLVEQSPDGIFVTDSFGHYVEVNSTGTAMLGYTREEVLARSIPDIIVQEDLHRLPAVMQSFADGGVVTTEWTILRKDGSTFLCEVVGRQLPDGRLQGILRDITERTRFEEALYASEAKFRAAFANAAIGFSMTTPTGTFVDANDAYCQLTGYSIAELCNVSLQQRIHRDDYHEKMRLIARMLAGEIPGFVIENRYIRKDGQGIWVRKSVSLVRDEHAAPQWILALTEDVTERKQAQEELLANEQRMRLATEATGVGIWEWNLLTNRIHWDAEMFRVYGIAPTADGYVEYADWSQAVLPEDLPRQEEILHDTARRLGHSQREFRIRQLDSGELRYIEAVETVRLNAQGQAEWVVGTNLDITAHRQTEQALRESDRHKDEFLAMLAHELRNPMAPIRNAAHVLGKLDLPEPRVRWAQDIIERQVGHLTRLVDDLLDVSRIAQGKITLSRTRIALDEVVRLACEAVQPLMQAKSHRFEVRQQQSGVMLDGDLVRLVQVLQNLLNNAAKYTPDGGHIELVTRRLEQEVEIEVSDNGMGIAAHLLTGVFDLFRQAESTLDRSQGGLGIGLTLVKRLVDLHDGHAEARSAGCGRGATFLVRLPLVDSAPAVSQPLIGTPKRGATQLRVLVVDDDPAVAESMVVFLELDGHQVRSAASGDDALPLLQEFQPQLVLLDLGLPGQDGYEVARRMRETPAGAGVKLVAVSGYGNEEAKERSRLAGFDRHLVKPVDPDVLYALLAEVGTQDQGGGHSRTASMWQPPLTVQAEKLPGSQQQ